MRGTQNRTSLWKWLTNNPDVEYVVPQQIYPFVDATKRYPLEYQWGNLTSSQAAAGPADLNVQLGPPQGKAWWVEFMSWNYTNVRANARVTVKLEKLNQAAVVIAGITLYEFPATAALVNVDTPIGQPGNLLASAGCGFNQCGIYLRGSDPGVQQTGSSTATLESLRLKLSETLINDQVNFRLRYLEFDLERPPGG